MIRPRFRLPIWAAVALVIAAYIGRSAMRGWDFTPDLPGDIIAYGLFLLVVVAVWSARARAARERDEELSQEMQSEDRSAREER
ncbi:MAG TPA: hypothetical protein VFH17_05825 [Coriobacteriia bacterium]|nr:hypothetical protein [Coriobacteriia bacterium]